MKLPRGADIYPSLANLPDFGSQPTMSGFADLSPAMVSSDWSRPVGAAAGSASGDGRPIVLENHTTLMLDGQVAAENMVRRVVQNKRGIGTVLKRGLPA
jgi:hypothetical protein